MTRNIFLSYGTEKFFKARDELCASASAVGFDLALARGPLDLDADFVNANAELLSCPRGAGYWAWKPQIILQELRKTEPDNVLVYCDAGRSSYGLLRLFPCKLIDRARRVGFVTGPTIPLHGPIAKWTKRDALLLLEMDNPDIYILPPIQATWSLWTPTKEAFRFLELWQAACADPRCVSDADNTLGLKNLADFHDHRHDQSISTLLTYREKAPHLDYRATIVHSILALRPQSRLAHFFLKRIDDAERLERGHSLQSLLYSFADLFLRKI